MRFPEWGGVGKRIGKVKMTFVLAHII